MRSVTCTCYGGAGLTQLAAGVICAVASGLWQWPQQQGPVPQVHPEAMAGKPLCVLIVPLTRKPTCSSPTAA